MPRIPYKTDEEAGPPELVAAIRQRRGGRLGDLDRILLYSAPFATGWGEMMGRVRNSLSLDAKLKEYAMCAVAALNDAEYEMFHHAPLLLQAGATQAQVDGLRGLPASVGSGLYDETEQAVLQLSVEMTRDVKVSDATFARARRALGDDTALFELVGVIAAYNMVSRILVAVGIEPEGH